MKTLHGRILAGAALCLLAILVIDLALLKYSLSWPTAESATFFVYAGALFKYFRWAKHPRLAEGTALIGSAVAIGILSPFAVFLAARSGMPLQDARLASFDHAIGLEVPHLVWTSKASPLIYASLVPLIAAATVLPTLFGRFQAVRSYLVSVSVATLVGAMTFALVPAIGPWSVYSMHPMPDQVWCGHMVTLLRQNQPYAIRGTDVGIVSFPSFHVVLAILSAVCLGSAWKWLRVPVAVLAILICASTLMTGWHYVADVLGGLGLSVLAITAARLTRLSERRLSSAN